MIDNVKIRGGKTGAVIAALLALLVLVYFGGLVVWAWNDDRKAEH